MTIVSSVGIRGGDAGAIDTLTIMAELVNTSLVNPIVVAAARELAVITAPARDQYRQAIGIRSWLGRVWRFVDDPTDTELLRDPEQLLRDYFVRGYIAGDCDEAAVLGAAMGKAIGLGATFTVFAFAGDATFSHVFASLLLSSGQIISLDVTKPTGSVPSPSRELTVEV